MSRYNEIFDDTDLTKCVVLHNRMEMKRVLTTRMQIVKTHQI